MKTARLCIGIISMVLFLLIIFQSCAAGIGEALSGDEQGGAASGVLVAWCMLIAGIVGVCTRNSAPGAYITAVIYAIAGIVGISSIGSIYADLVIWGVVSLIFAVVFVCGGILTKKKATAPNSTTEESAVKENKI